MSRYVLAAAALLAGCGPSTSLQNVWSAPDASTVSFDKVIVVGVSSQPSMRRSMEDHMVRVLTRVQATQSYLLLSDDEYNNHEAAKIKIEASGYDGAVIMRVVRQDQQQSYVPGSPMPAPYYSPYGYWGYSYSYAYSPGYMVTDEYVIVETNVYSLKDAKLLWSAQSESMNPGNVEELVEGVAQANLEEMRKRGVIGG